MSFRSIKTVLIFKMIFESINSFERRYKRVA